MERFGRGILPTEVYNELRFNAFEAIFFYAQLRFNASIRMGVGCVYLYIYSAVCSGNVCYGDQNTIVFVTKGDNEQRQTSLVLVSNCRCRLWSAWSLINPYNQWIIRLIITRART